MKPSLGGLIAATVVSILAFFLADSYAACLISMEGHPLLNLQEGPENLPFFLLTNGPLSLHGTALATGFVAACGVWMVWAYSLTHARPDREGEEHGSAQWGTKREGRKFMDTKDFANNIIFTENYGLAMTKGGYDPKYDRNKNVLVAGGSGSGKTRGYFEPNTMQMNANYFITDPKGESLPRMGHMLASHGYRIRSFNTVDFSKSHHYNPLAYVKDEADILEFVTCLIDNTTGDDQHSNDPFWENAERLLYVALIGYLVKHCPERDRSLSGLVTLLSLAKAKENDEDYESPLDLLFKEVEIGKRYVKVAEAENEPFDPRVRASDKRQAKTGYEWVQVAPPVAIEDDFCLLHYKMFKDAAGKTLKSILVSCNTRMEPFAIPQVRELVSCDEMELDRLGDAGFRRAVYAIMSDTNSLYSFLFAIMMWQAMNILCKRALIDFGGKLPTPVHFMFDEFANIGKLPDVEKTVAVIRSRNICMSIGVQSLSQLKSKYKDDAATIIDCCDTLLFLGGKSTETVKEISEAIGKQTVSTLTWNESRGSNSSTTRNYQTLERDLMQGSEVGRLPRDEAIVLITGTNPLRDKKYDIDGHPRRREVYGEPFDISKHPGGQA
ncbi:MAG: type IV secretory system conjugative DNA transfer family protein [Eggerthellaceae bacterium]|nr:type IV secretory system conjugative DNA transfer family protein [Eggerthellaceae bacterium]